MTRPHRHQLRYPALWAAIDGAIRDAIDGAIRDAMLHHSDIQIPDKRRASIVKRAVGAVLGLQGLGAGKPAETAGGALVSPSASGAHPARAEGLAHAPGQPHQQGEPVK